LSFLLCSPRPPFFQKILKATGFLPNPHPNPHFWVRGPPFFSFSSPFFPSSFPVTFDTFQKTCFGIVFPCPFSFFFSSSSLMHQAIKFVSCSKKSFFPFRVVFFVGGPHTFGYYPSGPNLTLPPQLLGSGGGAPLLLPCPLLSLGASPRYFGRKSRSFFLRESVPPQIGPLFF